MRERERERERSPTTTTDMKGVLVYLLLIVSVLSAILAFNAKAVGELFC